MPHSLLCSLRFYARLRGVHVRLGCPGPDGCAARAMLDEQRLRACAAAGAARHHIRQLLAGRMPRSGVRGVQRVSAAHTHADSSSSSSATAAVTTSAIAATAAARTDAVPVRERDVRRSEHGRIQV